MSLLDLTPQYSIRWRNWSETFTLMDYDPDLELLVTNRPWDSLFRIEHTGDQDAWIIQDQYALFMDINGRLDVGSLVIGAAMNAFPRVEVIRVVTEVPKVVATIFADGTLIVPNCTEDVLPAGGDQMKFYDKISFGPRGLVATKVAEVSLIGPPDGYFVDLTFLI
jgi:hypothetical protein